VYLYLSPQAADNGATEGLLSWHPQFTLITHTGNQYTPVYIIHILSIQSNVNSVHSCCGWLILLQCACLQAFFYQGRKHIGLAGSSNIVRGYCLSRRLYKCSYDKYHNLFSPWLVTCCVGSHLPHLSLVLCSVVFQQLTASSANLQTSAIYSSSSKNYHRSSSWPPPLRHLIEETNSVHGLFWKTRAM